MLTWSIVFWIISRRRGKRCPFLFCFYRYSLRIMFIFKLFSYWFIFLGINASDNACNVVKSFLCSSIYYGSMSWCIQTSSKNQHCTQFAVYSILFSQSICSSRGVTGVAARIIRTIFNNIRHIWTHKKDMSNIHTSQVWNGAYLEWNGSLFKSLCFIMF